MPHFTNRDIHAPPIQGWKAEKIAKQVGKGKNGKDPLGSQFHWTQLAAPIEISY